MSENRFHVIPRTRGWSILYLVVGLIAAANTSVQIAQDGSAILLVISLVAAVALIVAAVIGLMRSYRRA